MYKQLFVLLLQINIGLELLWCSRLFTSEQFVEVNVEQLASWPCVWVSLTHSKTASGVREDIGELVHAAYIPQDPK